MCHCLCYAWIIKSSVCALYAEAPVSLELYLSHPLSFMYLAAVWYSSRSITRLLSKMQNVQRYTLYWLSPSHLPVSPPLCHVCARQPCKWRDMRPGWCFDAGDSFSWRDVARSKSLNDGNLPHVFFPALGDLNPAEWESPDVLCWSTAHSALCLITCTVYVEHRQLLSELRDIMSRRNIR